jgi:hypothetical protein
MGQVNLNVTAVDYAYKNYFQPGRVERLGYEEQPTLGQLTKQENFYGRRLEFDVKYEMHQGSSDFATALANAGTGRYATFVVRRARYYLVTNFDNESMEAAEDNSGAYLDVKKEETEDSLKGTTERLGQGLFQNHGNSIGRANGISGSVVTLLNIEDIKNFRVGMKLQSSTADGTSGSVKAGTATVSAVDRALGKVTADFASITGFVGTASGDFIFPEGDFGLGIYGFPSYIPSTAPTGGDSVFTFDRSVDTRLSGCRYDGSTLNIADAIVKGLAEMRREAGSAAFDWGVCSHARFADLALDLGAKAMRDEAGTAEFGYDTIRVHNGGRVVKFTGDHNCQADTIWVLTKRTWIWKGLKKTPRFFVAGPNYIVDPTADGVQCRVGWRGNLLCLGPLFNGRITVATS